MQLEDTLLITLLGGALLALLLLPHSPAVDAGEMSARHDDCIIEETTSARHCVLVEDRRHELR